MYLLASCVRHAQGLGTDDRTLIEVICSHSNSELASMRAEYLKRELLPPPLPPLFTLFSECLLPLFSPLRASAQSSNLC
jgi:hypothetical protein